MPKFEGLDATALKEAVVAMLDGKSAAEVYVDSQEISLEKLLELETLVKKRSGVRFKEGENGEPGDLNYNTPAATSFTGRSYITLSHPNIADGTWLIDESEA